MDKLKTIKAGRILYEESKAVPKSKYDFVFSSNIEDWIGGYQYKQRKKHLAKKKNERNKV